MKPALAVMVVCLGLPALARAQAQTLTVRKVVVPATDPGRFTIEIDGVTRTTSPVGNGGSTGAIGVSAGSHLIRETAATGTNLALYTTTITCGTGTITGTTTTTNVTAGANVVCTITNTTSDITLTKVLVPASASGSSSSSFNLVIDGISRPQNASRSTGPVTVGSGGHTVGETANPPTSFADWDTVIDCGAAGMSTGATSLGISVPLGSTVSCTITNTRRPRLTITKVLKPTGDPGRFDLRIDGTVVKSGAVDGDSVGPRILPAGTHTVSETGSAATSTSPATNLADYITSIDCGAAGSMSGSTISLNLTNATDTTCTITNLGHARLTIVKSLLPPGDPGRFDLGISNQTGGTIFYASNVQNWTTSVIFVPPAPPGSYFISERATSFANPPTNIADYDTTIDCGSGPMATNTPPGGLRSTTAALSFNPGDSVTCTITNRGTPQVTLKKIVLPMGDQGVFNLQIDGTMVAPNVGNGASVTWPVTPNTSHTIGEAANPNYDTRIDCGQGPVTGTSTTINLPRGSTATCTITNLGPPRLTVTKIVASPVADTGRFNLQVDGATVASNVLGGGASAQQALSPGAHKVGEGPGTNTNLKIYSVEFGGDCAADGSITLARGDAKACTITNTNLRATCLADCSADRNECMANVGQPGAPLARHCANAFVMCQRRCPK